MKSNLCGMNYGLMLSIAMATNDITPPSPPSPHINLHKIQFPKGLYMPGVGMFLAYMCIHKYYCCQRFVVGVCCHLGRYIPFVANVGFFLLLLFMGGKF